MKPKNENPEKPKPKEKHMWFGYGYYDATFPSSGNPSATPNPNMLEKFLRGLGFIKKPPKNKSEN